MQKPLSVTLTYAIPAPGEMHMALPAAASDLLSNQPDEVLGAIVYLLPTKDGCRTQALSRRWRPIWRSVPLNLDAGDGSDSLSEQTMSFILSGHEGPVRRIPITGITHDDEAHDARISRFEACLTSRDVLAGLEVLELGYCYDLSGRDMSLLSLFHLAPALRVATLARCSLPPNLAVEFASLEKFSLYRVTLDEEALTALLAGCPALRSLLLEETVGCDQLRISSSSLRSIGFSPPWNKHLHYYCSSVSAQELVIEHAPCLERLLPLNPNYGPETVRVLQAPNLRILGCLGKGISELHLETTVFEKMIAISLTTVMYTVKVMALNDFGPDLDAVLDFLKCFPCLEKLYIVLDPKRFPGPSSTNRLHSSKNIKAMRKYASEDDPIECLQFHLKKMALKVYYGQGLEVEFARFFVLNAKVLERMEFGILHDHTDEWRDNQTMLLQLEDRASHDARFGFKKLNWSTLRNNNRLVHDLSIDDPFSLSFLEGYITLWEV